jgi:hypothetical protein
MKKLKSVLCVAMAVGVLAVSVPAASAAQNTFTVKNVGIVRFGMQEIEPGGTYTAADGEEIPAVVTYTDAQGKDTNYLPVRLLAELTNTPIQWDSESQSVAIGNSPVSEDGVQYPDTMDLPEEEYGGINDVKYGEKVGPFTEVDPSILDDGWNCLMPAFWKMNAAIENGFDYPVKCTPGWITTVSVTNHGKDTQLFCVYQLPTVTYGKDPTMFESIELKPGETLTRAFLCDADADVLQTTLYIGVGPEHGNATNSAYSDITVELSDYTYGEIEYLSPGLIVTKLRPDLPEVNHAQ